MPKVTIAIPTYNRQEYLRDCLKSIMRQSFQDFNIIIFDNHSDYNVRALLMEFQDPRISLVRRETNIGGTKNIEQIFQHPFAAPYIMVFHDDDTMHPKLLERGLEVMKTRPELVWVGTDLRFAHRAEDMKNFPVLGNQVSYECLDKAGLVRLILKNFNLALDTVLYKTAAIKDLSRYGEEFFKWWDRPYLVDLAGSGRVAVIKEKLVNYRMHPGQDSKADAIDKLEYIFKLFNFYRQQLPQPLGRQDKKLFYRWASNNTILSSATFSDNFKQYFIVLKMFKQRGYFKFRYLNIRGGWYLLKALKRLFLE